MAYFSKFVMVIMCMLFLPVAAHAWTDATLDSNVRIKAVHFQELKDKITELRGAAKCNAGASTLPGDFTAGSPVLALDINLLRSAVVELVQLKAIPVSDLASQGLDSIYNSYVASSQSTGQQIRGTDITQMRQILDYISSHALCSGGPSCGDGIVQAGEMCDDGASNGTYPPAYCTNTCIVNAFFITCGNGVVDPGEECDGGLGGAPTNNGPCQYGYPCSDYCTINTIGNCGTGVCGDGVVDPGEECDHFHDRGASSYCNLDCTLNNSVQNCPAGHWTVSRYSHTSGGWPCFQNQMVTGGGDGLTELSGCCDRAALEVETGGEYWRWWTPDNIDCCCPSDGMGGYVACGCETNLIRKYIQMCI